MAIKLFSTVTPGKRRKTRENPDEPTGPSLGIRDPRAGSYGFAVPAGNSPAHGGLADGNNSPADGNDPADNSSPADSSPANGGSSSSGTNTASSFDDYYNRLINTLRSYGINMELPTLEELYSQLSAFLRPSVDEAIANRRNYGETVLAELDADAYSRGMGGSSYLSSMKNREYDAAASDIAAMESKYSATLAQYIYNASNELARIQAEFEQLRRQHEYELQRQREQQQHELELQRRREQQALALAQLRAGRSGSSNSGAAGSAQDGDTGSAEESEAPYTEEEYRAHYNFYELYMRSITEADRVKLFHSTSEYWRKVRNEMLADLTPEAFEYLRRTYDPGYHGGAEYDRP